VKLSAPTARAEADVDQAISYYLAEASFDVAVRFVAAYEDAITHIRRFPGTGSPRYADLCNNAELRFWTLDRFPYAVFYIERDSFIDIVRVLHQASDIPAHPEP
jgi:toxin ParE1/3/4